MNLNSDDNYLKEETIKNLKGSLFSLIATICYKDL